MTIAYIWINVLHLSVIGYNNVRNRITTRIFIQHKEIWSLQGNF